MKTIVTLFIIAIPLSFLSQGKEAKDSLNYALYLLNSGVDFSTANRILIKYENEIKPDTNGIKFYITLSGIKGSLGRANESIRYANKAMDLSIKNNDFFKLEIDNLLGYIHNIIGDYQQGVYYLKQTLNKGQSAEVELTNYENIIQAYLKMNQRDSARLYADVVLSNYSENKNVLLNKTLFEIKVLKEKSKPNNQRQIIKIIKEGFVKGDLNKNGHNYGNIAICYQELKEFDSSLYYYDKAVFYSKLSKDTLRIVEAYQKMIELYDQIGENDKKEEIILKQYEYRRFIEEFDKVQYRDLIFLYDQITNKSKKNKVEIIGLFTVLSLLILGLVSIIWYKKKKSSIKPIKQTQISDEIIEKIKDGLIESEKNQDYLNPDFNLSFLEQKIGVNRKYLGIYLKEERQINLTTYTNMLRIKHAENRWKDPEDHYRKYTIEQMALEVGYKTPITFKKYLRDYSDIRLD